MKTVGFRIEEEFPLSGLDLKDLIKKFGTIYTLRTAPTEFALWLSMPENARIRDAMPKLVEWSGSPTLIIRPPPDKIDSAQAEVWKSGFIELYRFFKDVLEQMDKIVPAQAGRDVWDSILAKRDRKLIGKLRKEANL